MKILLKLTMWVVILSSCAKNEMIRPYTESEYISIGYSIDRGNASAYWIGNSNRMSGKGLTYVDLLYNLGDTISVKMGGIIYAWGTQDSIGFKIFRERRLAYQDGTKFEGFIEWKGIIEKDSIRTIYNRKY